MKNWSIVKLVLTESQINQCAKLLSKQGRDADTAIFGVIVSSYSAQVNRTEVSAQFCAVNWRAGQKVVALLRKEAKQ